MYKTLSRGFLLSAMETFCGKYGMLQNAGKRLKNVIRV